MPVGFGLPGPFDDRKGAKMKTLACVLILLLASVTAEAQSPKYAPLSEYLMEPAAEIALARSAAPDNISGRATVKVLTPAGFKVAAEGQNGFVCLVLRGWVAPTYSPAPFRDYVYVADLRAPICFDSVSARTMMPYYELRHKLGMDGKGPDEIARALRRPTPGASCQRWTSDQWPICSLPTCILDRIWAMA